MIPSAVVNDCCVSPFPKWQFVVVTMMLLSDPTTRLKDLIPQFLEVLNTDFKQRFLIIFLTEKILPNTWPKLMSLFRSIQIKELVNLGFKSPVFLPNFGAILKDHPTSSWDCLRTMLRWLSSLLFHRWGSQEHSLTNLFHDNLSLRVVCFLGIQPVKDIIFQLTYTCSFILC